MITVVSNWFKRHFSNPEIAALVLLLAVVVTTFFMMGGILTPLISSIVIAYLLNGMVQTLDNWKMPHTLSVSIVCVLFVGFCYLSLFVLVPLLWEQLSHLFNELPKLLTKGNNFLLALQTKYPDYVSAVQIQQVVLSFKSDFAKLGQVVLSYSLSSISNLLTLIIYLVIVPLLVFFLLKDTQLLIDWGKQFIPTRRRLINQVWGEVNDQIGKYIRAKVLEIIIVTSVSILAFILLGLNYAILLGVLVGLSVLIPFVGVTVVTIPVVLIAFLQWGLSADFTYLVITYAVIAILDGNVLAPLLFSEAVKLHPIAVIIAIILFGEIWGFWGVFFAIPLATVVKAIFNAWPVPGEEALES